MGRAGAKAGLSDPAVLDGKAVAQQIKGTPGITGLSPLSVHSGEEVWHLNTLGCFGSDPVPTNRLITVNPDLGSELVTPLLKPKRQRRGKTYCVLGTEYSIVPVTTDPKGKAPNIWGNTPTPVYNKRDHAIRPIRVLSDLLILILISFLRTSV